MRSQKILELIEMKISTTEEAAAEISFREALLPLKLQELRQKLGRKAKQQKRFRFYSLYGLVCRAETLQAAWAAVRRNDGAPGLDGQTIEQIGATPEREAAFLLEIERSLREKTYRADKVKRVYIPKANGKLRPVGIPTVRDRVVQAAVLLILEPIFEADLAGYFDSIPHDKLMACVRMRVVDGSVLGLIRQWLGAPVVEPASPDGDPPTLQRNHQGTPQGGVLSPLLANIYLHWFDHVFGRKDGPAKLAGAKLTRYADDFVVQAKYVSRRLQEWIEGKLEGWLGLKINREKTRVIRLWEGEGSLDFLGYTFRLDRDLLGRAKYYWNLEPSRKAMALQNGTRFENSSIIDRATPHYRT